MLDRLEQRPGELCRTLDWEIKLELYRDYVRGHELDWESFELWSSILEELEAAIDELPGEEPLTLKQALALESPVRSVADRLGRRLVEHGLTWNDVDRVLDLRARLLELEIRYSQIGPKSLLGQLQTAGRVNHRMPGVTDVDRAMSHPPPSGRARLRGQLVTRLATGGGGRAGWDRVFDRENRRALDLSDPFETQERWARRRPLERLQGLELFE